MRFFLSFLSAIVLLGGFSGCQIDKKFFQMSSDNPSPVLGLQLAPRAKKQDKSGIRGISATEEVAPVVELDRQDTASRRSKWPKWFGVLGKPKRIPLPRTDSLSGETTTEVPGASTEAVDGF